MSLSIIQIIILLGICQGFYFALILFFWKTIASRANMYLGFLLLSISGNLLQYWMRDVGLISNNELHLIFLPWHTVVAPFFLLYISELQIFKTRKIKALLFFIPCALVCLVQVLIKVHILSVGIIEYVTPSVVEQFYGLEEYLILLYSLALVLYVFYGLKEERLRTGLKGFGMNKEIVRWISGLSIIAVLLCATWFTSLFIYDELAANFSTYYFLWIVLVGIIWLLGTIGIYYSFKHRDRLAKKIEIANLPGHEPNGHRKLVAPESFIKINQLEAISALNQQLKNVHNYGQIVPILLTWLNDHLEVEAETCKKTDVQCNDQGIAISQSGKTLHMPIQLNGQKITLVLKSKITEYFNETHLYLMKLMGDVLDSQGKRIAKSMSVENHEENPLLVRLHELLNQHIYCSPTLDLSSLAEQIDISPGYLSKFINETTGMGFNDFINSHRIEYVKNIMVHPDYTHYTLASLGLEAGFNAKSTFYAAFRKLEKMSPGQYQRNLKKQVRELAFS